MTILTMPEAAERLRVPINTLRSWRHTGIGPQSFRNGRRVMYREEDLDRYLAERIAHERAASTA